MLWWMSGTLSDNQFNLTAYDKRTIIPVEECGTIFSELLRYAINIDEIFPNFIYKQKDDCLVTNIKLPLKDEISNFNDLRFTIKSYRYILNVFLSTGIIKDLKEYENSLYFDLLKIDFDKRADTLEYYLLNNPKKISKKRGYYDGLLELDFFRLIQEMYVLGLDGNKYCKWMVEFGTPLQIWFISTVQMISFICFRDLKIRDYKYYEKTIKYVPNLDKHCLEVLEKNKLISEFNMSSALNYTLSQLIINHSEGIGYHYTNYLTSIKKQAYAVAKGNYQRI